MNPAEGSRPVPIPTDTAARCRRLGRALMGADLAAAAALGVAPAGVPHTIRKGPPAPLAGALARRASRPPEALRRAALAARPKGRVKRLKPWKARARILAAKAGSAWPAADPEATAAERQAEILKGW